MIAALKTVTHALEANREVLELFFGHWASEARNAYGWVRFLAGR
jgi:hypothetical protein